MIEYRLGTPSPDEIGRTGGDPSARARQAIHYLEMFADRSVHHDGWRAVCPFPKPGREDVDLADWELYNVEDDPGEARNLADEEPDVLMDMVALWRAEAKRNRATNPAAFPSMACREEPAHFTGDRKPCLYSPGRQATLASAAAKVINRPYSITATVLVPKRGADGVIVCDGNVCGGYSLFIQDKHVYYAHNYVGTLELRVSSTEQLPVGRVRVRFSYQPTAAPDVRSGRGAPGIGRLFFDDRLVGEGHLPVTIPLALGTGAGLTIGRNPGSAISTMYEAPFPFTGRVSTVTYDL